MPTCRPKAGGRAVWTPVGDRAAADVHDTYRYAMTALYYVQIGDRPRISKESAQFFLDWATQRMESIQLKNPAHREAVLKYHARAVQYCHNMVAGDNAQ